MTVLRTIGVLGVILLACLGTLFIFDIIQREMMQDLVVKTLSAIGILMVASVSIGLLLKAPKS